ncbi:hypothetical protein [Flavobacterium sp.]|uniref:hypothetical protein n=1 Tax=Flavobacterium sp. TaxID=239 RepID=UPI0025F14064|nr:hypothetical protein [Flavobacterium sp.]
MKKFIAALTILLAFTINANAQDKNGLNSAEKGKQQATELANYIGLDQTMTENFARLFEQKFSIVDDPNTKPERKTELSRVIEAKIRGTLNDQQISKLEKNPELLKKLIN